MALGLLCVLCTSEQAGEITVSIVMACRIRVVAEQEPACLPADRNLEASVGRRMCRPGCEMRDASSFGHESSLPAWAPVLLSGCGLIRPLSGSTAGRSHELPGADVFQIQKTRSKEQT